MRTAPYPNSSLSRTPTGLITLQRVPPPRVLPPIAQHIIGLFPQSQTPPGWFEGARVGAHAEINLVGVLRRGADGAGVADGAVEEDAIDALDVAL